MDPLHQRFATWGVPEFSGWARERHKENEEEHKMSIVTVILIL